MASSDTSSSSSSSSSSSHDSSSSDSRDESDSVEVISPEPKRRRRDKSPNSTDDSDEASESDHSGELSSESGGDDQSSKSEGKSSDDNVSIADHKTLWNTLLFTDFRDSRDFGPFWKLVCLLKYNAPSLTKLELPTENPGFPDDAWDRLGWYIWNNSRLQCIVFKNCEYITNEEIRRIFGGGKRWHLRDNILSVSFSGCSFGRAGVKSMVPFLQSSVGIKWLSMRGTKIKSEGFELIAKSSAGSAISIFDFRKCGIDDFACLTSCRFPKLKGIDFNHNKCGDDGAEIIAKFLMKNSPQLERLHLNHNRIGDDGAEAIANALGSNKTLIRLDFNKNDLSIEGISSFSQALRNNHTLKILDVSRSTVGWNDACKENCDLQYRLEINKIYEGDPERAELTKSTAEKHYSTKSQEVDDEPGLLCPICTEKKTDFFIFLPCVHKICADCNLNFKDARCHTCRTPITERRRMF